MAVNVRELLLTFVQTLTLEMCTRLRTDLVMPTLNLDLDPHRNLVNTRYTARSKVSQQPCQTASKGLARVRMG